MLPDDILEDLSAAKASCTEDEWFWSPTLNQQEVEAWEALLDPLADRNKPHEGLTNPIVTVELHHDPTVNLHISIKLEALSAFKSPYECHVSGSDLPRPAQALIQDHLSRLIGTICDAQDGLALFSLIEQLRILLAEDEAVQMALRPMTQGFAARGAAGDVASGSPSSTLKRVLFWSHHLLATSKRKDIVGWGSDLNLWGLSKPGYPGVFIIEGLEADADEFAYRIKRLNWQALQVRCEETEEVPPADAAAKCKLAVPHVQVGQPKPVVLEVETMGELAAKMKAAGLHDMFLSAMRLDR